MVTDVQQDGAHDGQQLVLVVDLDFAVFDAADALTGEEAVVLTKDGCQVVVQGQFAGEHRRGVGGERGVPAADVGQQVCVQGRQVAGPVEDEGVFRLVAEDAEFGGELVVVDGDELCVRHQGGDLVDLVGVLAALVEPGDQARARQQFAQAVGQCGGVDSTHGLIVAPPARHRCRGGRAGP